MTDYKCSMCGASFPSNESLQSHAKAKISDESVHYREMLAHNQIEPIFPDTQEQPH